MGYDMNLIVFKKKSLETVKKNTGIEASDFNFSDVYNYYLFSYLHPDDYVAPKGEEGKWILSESYRIFDDFFKEENIKIDNDEAIIIEEELYKKMVSWIENKLKTSSLMDLVDKDDFEILIYVNVYQNLIKKSVDFETEFLIFTHNW